MPFTIEQYDTLKDAVAQGVLEVEYADKKIRYRSLSEMIQLLSLMEKDLNLKPNTNGRTYASFSKGLDSHSPDNFYCS